jgi:hypothetical protein
VFLYVSDRLGVEDWTVRFKMGSLRLYENMFTAPTIWGFVCFFCLCHFEGMERVAYEQ